MAVTWPMSIRVTGCGIASCREQGSGGQEGIAGMADRTAGNAMNPMVGSRVRHPGNPSEEKAAEVVENHEGGTRVPLAAVPRRWAW